MKLTSRIFSHALLLVVSCVFLPLTWGATDTLLILHTNDLHDHLRADYDGSGGLPFVSGYINQVKAERSDVIVLDAGDVAEKGDLVAFRSGSKMTYEAMSMIGYHAGAPGNHDHDFGIPMLRTFASLAGGMQMLCINLLKEDGSREFPASAMFDIDGVKVGVIGMIVPRGTLCLDAEETAIAMAREAERLDETADVVIAVCHFGSKDCAKISLVAPAIDIFVSGHSHEAMQKSVKVPETGALIVQTGSYAENVGRLEIEIDMETESVREVSSELIPMKHDTIACDVAMLEWIRREEAANTPEAREVVGWTDKPVGYYEIGMLAAAGLRSYGAADIGFCHAGQVVRDTLDPGLIDLNAVFRTGGERGFKVVTTSLTGAEIEAYMRGLMRSGNYQTQWSGFRAKEIDDGEGGKTLETNLENDRLYTVVMTEKEWESRLLRTFQRIRENQWETGNGVPERAFTSAPVGFSFTDAVVRVMQTWNAEGVPLIEGIGGLVAEAMLP
jgi:2',3'-cyclic-nucleotide 2'-phosphodiesterase (5'-nucleotidase family)